MKAPAAIGAAQHRPFNTEHIKLPPPLGTIAQHRQCLIVTGQRKRRMPDKLDPGPGQFGK